MVSIFTFFDFTALKRSFERLTRSARADLVKRSNDLFNVVKSGKVKIETTARYKLADAAQAHRDLEGRKTTGSVVLIP